MRWDIMTTQTITPAGWYADPVHRHQYRYWSGTEWTPMVSDNAITATDPVESPAQPASVPGATPQIATAPGQLALGVDPRIAGTVAEYAKRQYKVIGVVGSSVTMERSKNKFNWLLTVLLTVFTGVLAILYVVPWAIWGVHRTYRATITLGSQGEVEELGDGLAEFDRDRLQAHRWRCIGVGLVVALIAVFGAIGVIGSVASGDATDPLATALAGGGFVLVLVAIAFVPLRLARKAAQELGMASEWWRFGM
jgi:hypothetical protein